MEYLGVIFESYFDFKKHLYIVVSISFELLGFIKRSTKEFRVINDILNLYKNIVNDVGYPKLKKHRDIQI